MTRIEFPRHNHALAVITLFFYQQPPKKKKLKSMRCCRCCRFCGCRICSWTLVVLVCVLATFLILDYKLQLTGLLGSGSTAEHPTIAFVLPSQSLDNDDSGMHLILYVLHVTDFIGTL